MELALIIWAVGTLPSVALAMCFILFFLMCAAIIATGIGLAIKYDPSTFKEEVKMGASLASVGKTSLLICAPLWFIFLLVPDKTTAYQMLAGYGVQTIAQNDKVQEVAGDGVEVLQALMKKAKSELEKE